MEILYGKKLYLKFITEEIIPFMESEGFEKKGSASKGEIAFIKAGNNGVHYLMVDGGSTKYSKCEFRMGTYFPKYKKYFKELFNLPFAQVTRGFLTIRTNYANDKYFEEIGIPRNLGNLHELGDIPKAKEICSKVFNRVALPYFEKVQGLIDFRDEQIRDFKEDVNNADQKRGEITSPLSDQMLEILVITNIFEPENFKSYWDYFLQTNPLILNEHRKEFALKGLNKINVREAKELLKSEK